MSEREQNLYQTARNCANLTQEQAAAVLNVSETSIRAWETGLRVPCADHVKRMVDVYGTPWLAPAHIQAVSQILGVLPELHFQPLPTAVITLINRVFAFADQRRDRELLQIAEDGVIDGEERPRFEQIAQELDGIIAASMQVMYTREATKKEPPRGGNLEAVHGVLKHF